MCSTRYLAGALVAAASIAATSLLAIPASADVALTAGPNSSECINAKAILANASTAQAAAQASYNTAVKNRDAALDAYNAALSDSDTANDASALAALNSAKDALLSTNLILNERIKAVSSAQTKVDEFCAVVVPTPTPVPTTTPAPVGLPAPTPAPVIVYKYVNGQKCKCVNGGPCIPVTPTSAPTVVVTAPTQTLVAPPPVTAPSPVIIYPAPSTGTFSQIPSGSVPTGSVSTGDGSVQVDSDILTVTVLVPVHLARI